MEGFDDSHQLRNHRPVVVSLRLPPRFCSNVPNHAQNHRVHAQT